MRNRTPQASNTKLQKYYRFTRFGILLHFIAVFSPLLFAGSKHPNQMPKDVTVGVTVWPYERVYPLLDGLFQDVAATQVKTLQLDPNAANGTSLDALQQVFQLQAQFTATAGIQNGLAAQQAAANSSSALLQAQLIGRQSQLIQSQLLAQNSVGIAQKTVDSLTANGATKTDIDAAKQQLQLATDDLNSITVQLADIKAQAAQVSAPTFAPPNATFNANPPTLPSSLTGPANVPSGFSPNFPATKQMDNQMSLLWERLSRLVYTMNQTASEGKYVLIQVATGIVPINRKKKMLTTRYHLNCGKVVDIYPRASGVNIINEKYKETRFGLAALVQFFSWGLNASYNRNHLQITQMLSQSSYVTGFGVGGSDFGWIYGITLGEDMISPGTRDTFVLVKQDKKDCSGGPQLNLISVQWDKNTPITNFQTTVEEDGISSKTDTDGDNTNPVSSHFKKTSNQATAKLLTWPLVESSTGSASATDGTAKNASEVERNAIEGISYTPVEDDPTSQSAASVMVAITLQDDRKIDPETTVTADGILINRIRDNFGRAVTGGGSGGVLEVTASQLQLNTWIPVNSHQLILNLNPRSFRGHFPTVLLQSPREITEVIARRATVMIQGRLCEDCKKSLPPLSFPKVPISNLSIARWMFWSNDPKQAGTGTVHLGKDAKIIINAINAKSSAGLQSSSGPAPLQIIDDADSNPWGSNPQVQLIEQVDAPAVLRLDCGAVGPQLVCPSVNMTKTGDHSESNCKDKPCVYTNKAYVVDVIDADHAGGPFHGRGTLAACGEDIGILCSQPLIWKMEAPSWSLANPKQSASGQSTGNWNLLQGVDGWIFRVWMVNISTGERAQLNRQDVCRGESKGPCHDLNSTFDCPGDGRICSATFVLRKELLPSYQDSMELQVYPERTPRDNTVVRAIKIGGLRSQISPLLSSISSDSTHLTGSNLVFDEITIGSEGTPIHVMCSPPTDCTVTYPSTAKKGYLYFVAQKSQGESGLIPMVLQAAQGTAKVLYTPPEKSEKKAPSPATPQVSQPVQSKVPLSSMTE